MMISTITHFDVARVLAGFYILISIARIIIVFAIHKNIPKVLRGIHAMIAFGFLSVTVAIPNWEGYYFKNEGIYLLVMLLVTLAAFIACIVCSLYVVPKLQAIDKAVERRLEYRKLTAEIFAQQNGVEYVSSIHQQDVTNSNDKATQLLLRGSKYLMLLPLNGKERSNPTEWVEDMKLENNFLASSVEVVLSNENCFNGITNLDEILEQMICLYSDNLDKEIFISSSGFAIKLEDELQSPYQGKAQLVLTDKAILNNKVGVSDTEKEQVKKDCINTFLSVYLKLNFGRVFNNNKELNQKLKDFNSEVIKRGLKENIINARVKYNQYVQKIRELDTQNDVILD